LEIHEREGAEKAALLLELAAAEACLTSPLALHAGNRSPATAATMKTTIERLGVISRSLRTANRNEAVFTCQTNVATNTLPNILNPAFGNLPRHERFSN
jgi:hypothetical protein